MAQQIGYVGACRNLAAVTSVLQNHDTQTVAQNNCSNRSGGQLLARFNSNVPVCVHSRLRVW